MRSRYGASLAEIVVALAILGVALLPVLDLFHGARRRLAVSAAMLRLQTMAQELLAEGRASLAGGRLLPSDGSGDEVLVRERDGLRGELRISVLPTEELLVLRVRVVGGGRAYEIFQAAHDPFVFLEPASGGPTPGGPR